MRLVDAAGLECDEVLGVAVARQGAEERVSRDDARPQVAAGPLCLRLAVQELKAEGVGLEHLAQGVLRHEILLEFLDGTLVLRRECACTPAAAAHDSPAIATGRI